MSSPPRSAGSAQVGPYPTGTDGWIQAEDQKPYPNQIVNGWTGRFMVKCKYNYDKEKWETKKGTVITVMIWNKIIGQS